MSRDTHLVNIYLKIHNKRPLTMDDLRYLAKYDPECFEKTCRNVVYNNPATKPIMEPTVRGMQAVETDEEKKECVCAGEFGQWNIEQILANIKRLERKEFPIVDIEADKVKNLLGNLYMEMLFPHNDKETFIGMPSKEGKSTFDKKA